MPHGCTVVKLSPKLLAVQRKIWSAAHRHNFFALQGLTIFQFDRHLVKGRIARHRWVLSIIGLNTDSFHQVLHVLADHEIINEFC